MCSVFRIGSRLTVFIHHLKHIFNTSVSALATCINVLIAALVNDEIYNVSFVLSETTPIRRNLHIVFQKKQ